MTLPTEGKVYIVANPPAKAIESNTFALETRPLPALEADQVLLELLYLSNDPAQRGWIQKDASAHRLYVPPIRAGEVMRSGAIGKVLATKSDKFKEGQLVSGQIGWQEYAVMDAKSLIAVSDDLESPTIALGLLGGTGLTAWSGLHYVGEIKKEHVVVISGAAGSTGSTAVQIAKNVVGCRKVVGIAGGKEKCAYVESLGADVCVDYKSATFEEDLAKALPEKDDADLYFDNVGGDILNAMLPHVKRWGKVIACGSIATYNDADKQKLPNWFEIIANRITVTGFIVFDFASRFAESQKGLKDALKAGQLKITGDHETVHSVSFEKIPQVWEGLFQSQNRGKLITKIDKGSKL